MVENLCSMVYFNHDPLYSIQARNWKKNNHTNKRIYNSNKRKKKKPKKSLANINVIGKVICDAMPYWVNLGYQKFIANYSHFFAELQNLVIPSNI